MNTKNERQEEYELCRTLEYHYCGAGFIPVDTYRGSESRSIGRTLNLMVRRCPLCGREIPFSKEDLHKICEFENKASVEAYLKKYPSSVEENGKQVPFDRYEEMESRPGYTDGVIQVEEEDKTICSYDVTRMEVFVTLPLRIYEKVKRGNSREPEEDRKILLDSIQKCVVFTKDPRLRYLNRYEEAFSPEEAGLDWEGIQQKMMRLREEDFVEIVDAEGCPGTVYRTPYLQGYDGFLYIMVIFNEAGKILINIQPFSFPTNTVDL